MAFFLNLFTAETWDAFRTHGSSISGFRHRQRRTAQEDIHAGDIFICYLVGLSRWCGVLRNTSKAFRDTSPIFDDPDPFVWRFKVEPLAALDPLHAVPIFDDRVWTTLSLTKGQEKGARGWAAAYFRASLRRMEDSDGEFLSELLREQANQQTPYQFTDRDKRQLGRTRTVRT
ncbi:MAG: hypothetical protein ACREER_02130, partial [Alphaproteobacteria bacterium]